MKNHKVKRRVSTLGFGPLLSSTFSGAVKHDCYLRGIRVFYYCSLESAHTFRSCYCTKENTVMYILMAQAGIALQHEPVGHESPNLPTFWGYRLPVPVFFKTPSLEHTSWDLTLFE